MVVIDKLDGRKRIAGDHYGDPEAGLITPDEQWFVSVGDGVQCLRADGRFVTFFHQGRPPLDGMPGEVAWSVTAVDLTAGHTLRIIVDPNSDEASEWLIDLDAEVVTRVG
ncbi:MAG TPA: hypothetical protein VF453_02700 [Burkholderiaceae bacterium]